MSRLRWVGLGLTAVAMVAGGGIGGGAARAATPGAPAAVYCDMAINIFLDPRFYVSKVFTSTDTEQANERRFYTYLNTTLPGGVQADRADPPTCSSFDSIRQAQQARQQDVDGAMLRHRANATEVNWP